MDLLNIAVIAVVIAQIATGIAKAAAAKKAAAGNGDLLAEIVIGKNTIKFDKTDILAVALAVFVFWAVGADRLPARDGLTAFVAVLTGTGVKEFIEAWYPTT